MSSVKLSPEETARFWSKVDTSGGPEACWNWTASTSRGSLGYGAFALSRHNPTARGVHSAHKISVIIAGRPPEPGQVILHLCDNPKCVNPDHLRLGSQLENVRDCVGKQRHATRLPRFTGHQKGGIKRALRRNSWGTVAAKYGLNRGQLRRVLEGK